MERAGRQFSELVMDKKALIKALRDKPQLGRPDIKGIPRRVTDAVNRNIATLLGTPVDAVTNAINLGIAGAGTLGHKLGLVSTPPNVIESPIGGSEWFGQQMEQRGMVSPERNTYNEVMAGLLMPAATTRAAKTLFNAEQQAARNIAAPDTLNTPGFRGQRGAIVWHGSPHKFEAFDASKIGTGSGTTAYGHGAYFAEHPNTAKLFQKDLSTTITIDGKPIFTKGKMVGTTGNSNIDDLLVMHSGDIKNATKDKINEIRELRQRFSNEPKFTSAEMAGVEDKIIKQAQQELAQLRKIREKSATETGGYLYKVDLPDEAIARMLDWDKPLSQQAQNVQQSLSIFPEIKKGSAIHQQLTRDLALGEKPIFRFSKEGQKEAAEYLKQAGIPGIKYLDEATGKSNFVVFPGEERLLRILERNNQPMGLMGAPKQTGLQATITHFSNATANKTYAYILVG